MKKSVARTAVIFEKKVAESLQQRVRAYPGSLTYIDLIHRNRRDSTLIMVGVILLGVPQTYPPQPVNGYVVSCFLTPSRDSAYTYPATLKAEIISPTKSV